MLLIEVHSTCCSINAPSCQWSSQINTSPLADHIQKAMAQDPWHPGDKQSRDSVLTEKHAATRLHPSPEQTCHTLDKRRTWVQMSTVRSVQPQLHPLTELHNKPPNHQLAARNLSSSCVKTPTPGWRRQCGEKMDEECEKAGQRR